MIVYKKEKLHKLFINGQYFASVLHNNGPQRKRALELHVAQHVMSEKILYLHNRFRTWLTEMKKACMLNKYPTQKTASNFRSHPLLHSFFLAYSLDDGTLPVSAPFTTHLHIRYKLYCGPSRFTCCFVDFFFLYKALYFTG